MVEFFNKIFGLNVDDSTERLHNEIKELQQRVEILYAKVSKQHDDIQNFINSWTEE